MVHPEGQGAGGVNPKGVYAKDTAFSRTGITSPLGKFDEELKCHIDESTANKFRKRAADLEQTPSELLRDLVYLETHGEILIEMCAKHHRALRNQQGPNRGVNGEAP